MKLHKVLTLRRPLVGIDLETTGLTKRDRIVQLALEIYNPLMLTPESEYVTLVNPLMPIPKEASDVHGITDEMIKDAPTFQQLAVNLHMGLQGCDFVGKNIKRFDLPFIQREFASVGKPWDWEGAALLDVDRLWQLASPRHLKDAVNAWGSNEDVQELGELQAHDALADVKWAGRVAANMIQHCGMMGWTPDRVHEQLYPDDYDSEGKLKWLSSGELAMTFGDWRDVPLSRVDAGFLRWILKKDFSDKVKSAVQAQLLGHPLRKEHVSKAMRDL